MIVLVAATGRAETWRIEPAVAVEVTATDNVSLNPRGATQSDFVTQVTPGLRVTELGARTRLDAYVAAPMLVYARTGTENNKAYPFAQVAGNAELVEKFFFVEGFASVTQTFFNPFGPTPPGLVNATENRSTEQSYRVSPYIRGTSQGNVEYELRNNNVWTNLNGAPIATRNSHLTEWVGRLSNLESRLGWRVDLDYTDIHFTKQTPIQTQLYRFSPLYSVDPQLRLSASAGYEFNEYTFTHSEGAIYGVGFEWRPTERTNVVGNWEHRFFGSSYLFTFDHRTPLSIWNVQVSRNITSYPQELFGLPAGVNVGSIINSLFQSRYPDPVERQRAVDQFMQERGLPSTLSSPLTLYSEQIILQELQSVTAGLIGARNSILMAIFNLHSVPIAASGTPLPPALAINNNNTQTGASLVWTHGLTTTALLDASVTATRTAANSPFDAKTDQVVGRIAVSTPVAPSTTVYAGARYQVSRTNVGNDYNEAAAFAGLTHTFR